MNEQRQSSNLQLLQVLLNCSNQHEWKPLLQDNLELIDPSFIKIIQRQATEALNDNNQELGDKLLDLAHLLNQKLYLPSPENYSEFLLKLIKATQDSGGDPEIIYPILEANLDKLDENLGLLLEEWLQEKIAQSSEEDKCEIAGTIFTLVYLLQQFPLHKAAVLEIAIMGYQLVLKIFTQDTSPYYWASTQNNLSNAYIDRIQGDKAQNIELAIEYYQKAEDVFRQEVHLYEWAKTQYSLGNTYRNRRQGDKAQNIELAIKSYEKALDVLTQAAYPDDWAKTQNNLALAYMKRSTVDKSKNIEIVIECYQKALQVFTQEQYPHEWGLTQNNLGIAYKNRILGDKAQNIDLAIECYQKALQVRNQEKCYPKWAVTHKNLQQAYQQQEKT